MRRLPESWKPMESRPLRSQGSNRRAVPEKFQERARSGSSRQLWHDLPTSCTGRRIVGDSQSLLDVGIFLAQQPMKDEFSVHLVDPDDFFAGSDPIGPFRSVVLHKITCESLPQCAHQDLRTVRRVCTPSRGEMTRRGGPITIGSRNLESPAGTALSRCSSHRGDNVPISSTLSPRPDFGGRRWSG
jgi:hypothetical protein